MTPHVEYGARGVVIYRSPPKMLSLPPVSHHQKSAINKAAAKQAAVRQRAAMMEAERDRVICTHAPEATAGGEVETLIRQNIPESIFSRLFPFQREGVLFGVKHQGRVLLGDETGLGKNV